jgi:hypothetical protein
MAQIHEWFDALSRKFTEFTTSSIQLPPPTLPLLKKDILKLKFDVKHTLFFWEAAQTFKLSPFCTANQSIVVLDSNCPQ